MRRASLHARLVAGNAGQATVVALAVIGLVAAALVGVVLSSTTDLRIAVAFARAAEADAAADAGVARALVDLAAMPDWTAALDGSVRSGFVDGVPAGTRTVPGGLFVDLDLAASLATCGHAPPCSDVDRVANAGGRAWGADNPRWRLFAYGPLAALLPTPAAAPPAVYVVVMVGDDPAESDGNPERDGSPPRAGAGILRVRSEAHAPGGTRRVAEALVGRPPAGPGIRVLRWSRAEG